MMSVLLLAIAMPSEPFVDAVARTESNHRHEAVGDGGRAIGAWQIWDSAWQTANDFRVLNNQTRINRQTATKSQHREIARWLLAWHMKRLTDNGIAATPQHVYLSYTMGFAGFKAIGFNPCLAPPVKQRALKRLNSFLP